MFKSGVGLSVSVNVIGVLGICLVKVVFNHMAEKEGSAIAVVDPIFLCILLPQPIHLLNEVGSGAVEAIAG